MRPDIEDVASLPSEIIESSRKHFPKWERLWYSERELVDQVLNEEEAFPYAYRFERN